jgi:hypothetical protein
LDDGQRQGHDWRELAHIASAFEQKNVTPIFLPRFVAISVAGIVEALARATGRLPFVSPDKIKQLYFSDWVSRGEGWPLKDPVSFDQGLSKTLDWYRKEQWLPQRVIKHKIVA